MLMSPVGLRPEKDSADETHKKTQNYRTDFSLKKAPPVNKSLTV
jgi:hypothetical protein